MDKNNKKEKGGAENERNKKKSCRGCLQQNVWSLQRLVFLPNKAQVDTLILQAAPAFFYMPLYLKL